MKQITIYITHCGMCPNYVPTSMTHRKGYCGKMDESMAVLRDSAPPAWCPLPDANEKEQVMEGQG